MLFGEFVAIATAAKARKGQKDQNLLDEGTLYDSKVNRAATPKGVELVIVD